MIPSCSSLSPISRIEQSMPLEATPRMVPALSSAPVPGRRLPTGAKTPFMPVRALGAPQTPWTSPVTVSSVQSRSRSALGCGRASLT